MIKNPQQNLQEFEWWCCRFVQGKKSLLEIGSSAGISLMNMACYLEPGAKIRSIDLGVPHESGSTIINTREKITSVMQMLRSSGFDADCFFGNSHSEKALQWAKVSGPYDLIFIDGDHTYDGVASDLASYHAIGEVIALHDIGHINEEGPRRLWSKMFFATDEFTVFSCNAGKYGGIGVLARK